MRPLRTAAGPEGTGRETALLEAGQVWGAAAAGRDSPLHWPLEQDKQDKQSLCDLKVGT